MLVTLLNGENSPGELANYAAILENRFRERNHEVRTVNLSEKMILPCTGCFKCWVKTPGRCIIKDHANEISEMFINSDLMVFLSPVVFGTYSSQMKKSLDRMICLISPFFMKIEGEVHHRPRYKKYPSILAIGVMDIYACEHAETFKTIVRRNSINFHAPACESAVFTDTGGMEREASFILDRLEKEHGKK